MFVYCGAQLPLILILIGMNILSTNYNNNIQTHKGKTWESSESKHTQIHTIIFFLDKRYNRKEEKNNIALSKKHI